MKKNRSKKLLVAVLAIVTVFSVCTTAFAADIGRFDTSIAALKIGQLVFGEAELAQLERLFSIRNPIMIQ